MEAICLCAYCYPPQKMTLREWCLRKIAGRPKANLNLIGYYSSLNEAYLKGGVS